MERYNNINKINNKCMKENRILYNLAYPFSSPWIGDKSNVVEEGKSKVITVLSGFGLMKERKNNDNKKKMEW